MNVNGNIQWVTDELRLAIDAIRFTLPPGCPPIPREAAETLGKVMLAVAHNGHVRWVGFHTTKAERSRKSALTAAEELILAAHYLHREAFAVFLREVEQTPEQREPWRAVTVCCLLMRQAAQESFPEAWSKLSDYSSQDDPRIWSCEVLDPWAPIPGRDDPKFARARGAQELVEALDGVTKGP